MSLVLTALSVSKNPSLSLNIDFNKLFLFYLILIKNVLKYGKNFIRFVI
jgi:hypothetical protein